jgi:crotonobetainyl-CoA:carnitine CoA-transferase CaiB-like acyl-CoA transferase
MTAASARPLAGLRIIAVEQYGAGPWGTMQLADLGADVVKIEDPATGGDVSRYVPPFQAEEDSLFFESFNRGKRSVSLDLKHPDGRVVFEDLLRGADALFANVRGDVPALLGLDYASVEHVNPRLVCCVLSGYGRTGPRRAQGAYDHVMQATAGWMALTGEPDAPPTKSGLSLVDLSAGYVSAIALLAGVMAARRDGVGGDWDLSLHEVALSQLCYLATWHATGGHEARRMPLSAHPSIVPFQLFAAADGHLAVACPKEKFWRRLCVALDRPDLLDDPRCDDFHGRDANRDFVLGELGATFRSAPCAEWIARLEAAGVPAAAVNDVPGALADPQAQARGALVDYEHPRFGTVRQVASPLRHDAAPPSIARGPRRGEHQQSVLADVCGYDPARIAALCASGAFGAQEDRVSVAVNADDGRA